MSFQTGDRVMVESPKTGYAPPRCAGNVAAVGRPGNWDNWVKVQTTYGCMAGSAHWYPSEAVRHID